MSDQSLREALEELASERDSVSGHVASDYYIRPYELRDLLAAHPAPECAGHCYSLTESGAGYVDPKCPKHGRAAAPHLAPKVDREQIAKAIHDAVRPDCQQPHVMYSDDVEGDAADAVLALLNDPPAEGNAEGEPS